MTYEILKHKIQVTVEIKNQICANSAKSSNYTKGGFDMNQFLIEKRNPILFPESAADFSKQLETLKTELKALMADNPEGKDFYLKTAVDVAVDLRSWLAEFICF